MYLIVFGLLVIFNTVYSPSTSYDNDNIDTLDDFDSSFYATIGDIHSRFERAISSQKISKIMVVNRKRRRQFVIQCCGRNACYDGSRKSTITKLPTTITTTSTTTTTPPTTTTTRCVPVCSTCGPKNTALWDVTGKMINANQYGAWGTACNKLYLFNKASFTQDVSFTACCDFGMTLISVETKVDQQCLEDAFNAVAVTNGLVPGPRHSSAFTSGCKDEKGPIFAWCPSGREMNKTFWYTGEPKGGLLQCATIDVASGGVSATAMRDIACGDMFNYICEGSTTTCSPLCPIIDCTTIAALYGIDGELTTIASVGTWKTPQYSTCDNKTLYLFSAAAKPFEDAMKYCCSIGMTLVSFDTPEKYQCILDLNSADTKLDIPMWTSGSNLECPLKFQWCPTKTLFYPNFPWGMVSGKQAPDNFNNLGEWCAEIWMKPNKVDAMFNDEQCSISRRFICEGPTTTTTTCATPTCTDISCVKDSKIFASDGKVLTPAKFGTFYNVCGSNYMFSSLKTSYCVARKACCRLGMELISFETPFEVDCIYSFNIATAHLNGMYYTSARSSKVMTGFEWCPSRNLVPYIWSTGEPQNSIPPEYAVAFNLDQRASRNDILLDVPVTFDILFACEDQTTTIATPCDQCPVLQCTTEKTNFDIDGTLKNPASHGVFRIVCNRLYMYSYPRLNQVDATKYCCSVGMNLIAVETVAENQCLIDMNNADPHYVQTFWTSGSQRVCPGTFKWCSTNTTFTSDIAWTTGQPDNYQNNEHCVMQQYNNQGITFKDVNCGIIEYFICEGPTTTTSTCATPTCTDIPCIKDDSLFGANGKVLAPASFGTFYNACGTNYMFSSGTATYCKARKICCRLGMELISFETQAEINCFYDFNIATAKKDGMYFTSARSSTLLTGFEWCPSRDLLPFLWVPGEPQNLIPPEYGVALILDQRTTGRNNILVDVPVTFDIVYICEDKTTTLAPPPCEAKCPDVQCTTQRSLFELDGSLKSNAGNGLFKVACDKLYMYSYPKKNQLDAYKHCCTIGMQLLSVETVAENQCLTDLNGVMGFIDSYWTSGSQISCPGKFKWCQDNSTFTNDVNWAKNEPNNYQNNEACVMHTYLPGIKHTFKDMNCDIPQYFVCEGPTTTTTTCRTPTCTDIPCQKNDILFDANNDIIAPDYFGKFYKACGTTIMYSADKTTYCTARKVCCGLGMQLLSLENQAKVDCVFDLQVANSSIQSIWHYVSAWSPTVLVGYTWCPSKIPVEPRYIAGEPQNAIAPEHVLGFFSDKRTTGRNTILADFPAHWLVFFACEGTTAKP